MPTFVAFAAALVVAVPVSAMANESRSLFFTVRDVVDAEDIFGLYGEAFGFGSDDELRLIDVVRMAPDRDVYRFQQYHDGMPVLGGQVAVQARLGRAASVVGRLEIGLQLSELPARSESEARRAAEQATGARSFAPNQPRGVLAIMVPRGERGSEPPQVVWRFVVNATLPAAQHVVTVDAYDLRVVELWKREDDVMMPSALASMVPGVLPSRPGTWVAAPGFGQSLYNGGVQLDVEMTTTAAGNRYSLRHNGTAPVYTFDAENQDTNYILSNPPREVVIDGNTCSGAFEECIGGQCTGQFTQLVCPNDPVLSAAVSAHYSGLRMMGFLENVLEHTGADGGGAPVVLLVNRASTSPNAGQMYNAVTNGVFTAAFDRNGSNPAGRVWDDMVDFQTVAHEIAHAVVNSDIPNPTPGEFGLKPSGVPGAISEGLADIYALAAEHEVFGGFNWLYGSVPMQAGSLCIRNIADPHAGCSTVGFPSWALHSPTTYQGLYWQPPIGSCEGHDQCFKHVNSTVVSYWYYLLMNGCTNCVNDAPVPQTYTVQPVAPLSAIEVAHYAAKLLTSNATFADLRAHTIDEAVQRFGPNTPEHINVTNAWYAVGVDGPYEEPPIIPAEGENEVEPWKAELEFELGMGYSPAFPCPFLPQDAQEMPHRILLWEDDATPQGPIEVVPKFVATGHGSAEVVLRPDTIYHWQVLDPNITNCQPTVPRGMHTFKTAKKVTELKSPTRGTPCTNFDKDYTHGECHPWDLVFQWQATPGATSYYGEVGETHDYNDPSVVQFWWTSQVNYTTDVLVEKPHHWFVRPRGPTTVFGEVDNDGSDKPNIFSTTMPSTVVEAPMDPTPYPWPVNHAWQKVTGVDHYEFKLFGGDGTYPGVDLPDLKAAQASIYMPASNSADPTYEWEVQIVGPPLAYLNFQSEYGEPLLGNTYQIHAFDTHPAWVHPILWPTVCDPYEDKVNLEWTSIPGADHYEVTLVERRYTTDQGYFDKDTVLAVNEPHNPNAGTQSLTTPPRHEDLISSLVDDEVYGWRIHVLPVSPASSDPAIPGSHEGIPAHNIMAIQPPPMNFMAPHDNAVVMVEPNVPRAICFQGAGDYAHRGLYDVQFFDNPDCNGMVISEQQMKPYIQCGASLLVNILTVSYETKIGWRATPHAFTFDGCKKQWSPCQSLTIMSYDDPIPPNAQPISCNVTATYTEGQNLDQDFTVEVGYEPGIAYLAINTLTVPDHIQFTYAGLELWPDHSCLGTGATDFRAVYLDGTDHQVEVHVDANCNNQINTRWGFRVGCVNDDGVPLDIPLE